MENSKALVREFGEQTLKKTEETAKKLGVSTNREFMDKSYALAWAMAAIVREEDGIDIEPIKPYIEIAEGMTPNERGITFCFNTCRGGFSQLEAGDLSGALEAFGLARMIIGHLARNDIRKILSDNARKGAIAKLANDPKQEAKRFVKECWQAWQNNPDKYKSQAKFARDMLDKCPSLENQASVENWCREWKRACSAS